MDRDRLWSRFILQLGQRHPFFACVALFSTFVLDDTLEVAVTRGREIRVAPGFLASLDEAQRFAFLLHQVLHLALQHPRRGTDRHVETWNVAADIVVNHIIDRTGDWPPATGTAWDNRFEGQSVEQVYAALLAQFPECAAAAGDAELADETGDDAGPEPGHGNTDESGDRNDGGDETTDGGSCGSSGATASAAARSGADDADGTPKGGGTDTGSDEPRSATGQASGRDAPDRDATGRGGATDRTGQASRGESAANASSPPTRDERPAPSRLRRLYAAHPDITFDRDARALDAAADDDLYWRRALTQAGLAAGGDSRGDLPAGLRREFERALRGRVDWRAVLWRHASDRRTDYTEFDRRHVHRGLYVEELRIEGLSLAVAIDTSGSITEHELGLFMGELGAIVRLHVDVNIELYYCDAGVDGPHPLGSPRDRMPAPSGGGGTSFVPFFERLDASPSPDRPDAAIYFTDGHGRYPDAAPSTPTLWVLLESGVNESEVPFGRVVTLADTIG